MVRTHENTVHSLRHPRLRDAVGGPFARIECDDRLCRHLVTSSSSSSLHAAGQSILDLVATTAAGRICPAGRRRWRVRNGMEATAVSACLLELARGWVRDRGAEVAIACSVDHASAVPNKRADLQVADRRQCRRIPRVRHKDVRVGPRAAGTRHPRALDPRWLTNLVERHLHAILPDGYLDVGSHAGRQRLQWITATVAVRVHAIANVQLVRAWVEPDPLSIGTHAGRLLRTGASLFQISRKRKGRRLLALPGSGLRTHSSLPSSQ
jgi:hypothetical protein